MKIAIIGTGYVGLVTGVCLAEMGNSVTCIDIDAEKINTLNNGGVPIYEKHLDNFLQRNRKKGRLNFTTELKVGLADKNIIFLALPTPPDEDGSADLQYVLKAAEDIAPLLKEYTVIVDKSTVPVGTADKVRAAMAPHTNIPFDVVSNPEFLREGSAIDDFMKPERIVIGTSSPKAKELMQNLYDPFVRQGNPVIFMDERSAELTKYASNSFLAVKITFMNEIAEICERLGANVDEVRKGMGTDSRIGNRFLFPGIGYGGSCFPKDVRALIKSSSEVSYDFQLLNTTHQLNEQQKTKLFFKLNDYFGGILNGKTIAFWGLSFKPYTDDIREAPALENIKLLLNAGATIHAFDPEGMENTKRYFSSEIKYFTNEYDALKGADALFIATEWPQFRTPDFEQIINNLNQKVVFDGRNVFKPSKMQELGFDYFSMGREHIQTTVKTTV